jgi:hypothetical protein
MQEPDARLTPGGRHQLVLLFEHGSSLRSAASCNVALSTAHRWVVRWRAASLAERASLGCLWDRSSRRHHSPGCSRRTSSSACRKRERRPAATRECWQGRSTSPSRRSGRCLTVTAARARHGPCGRPPTGMSGRVPATCCTRVLATTSPTRFSSPRMMGPSRPTCGSFVCRGFRRDGCRGVDHRTTRPYRPRTTGRSSSSIRRCKASWVISATSST